MKTPHHRRDFVRSLALGASALSAPGAALGDEPGKDEPHKLPSEAEARMELVLARFGSQLNAGARDVIRAEVEATVLRAEGLRKFPLENGDGPMPTFTPYRAELKDSEKRDHGDTEKRGK